MCFGAGCEFDTQVRREMTGVFVVLIEDRHTEVEPYVFRDEDEAIEFAKEFVHQEARRAEDVEELEIDGWLYYATYSVEADCVSVREVELQ